MAETANTDANAPLRGEGTWNTVSRVVFPGDDADTIMPLYALRWTRPTSGAELFDSVEALHSAGLAGMNRTELGELARNLPAGNASSNDDATLGGALAERTRTAVTLAPGAHVSFCTYFNAFPASYWQRWTDARTVRFTAQVLGEGSVTLFRSTARGLAEQVQQVRVGGSDHVSDNNLELHQAPHPPQTARISVDIPLSGMLDGGYLWFDAAAQSSHRLEIRDAAWQVPAAQQAPTAHNHTATGRVSIAITTFNRPSYCLRQLQTIAAEPALRERLDTIYCVDQGTDLVSDQPGFTDVEHELGTQLTYLQQRNIGGSGGFARGMLESVEAGSSDYTILLDDDAITEPESLLRAARFEDYARRPVLVGGGMFHLDNRTMLHVQGERFDRSSVQAAPPAGAAYNHDFARSALRDSPSLHRRFDCDYNGWWMCLIPNSVIAEIGLPMPLFIKYDDVEYGLRAKEHGYPTVGLPGVAVWHQGWHDKDVSRTWEEYFTQRNRWICALMHFPAAGARTTFRLVYEDAHLGVKLLYSGMKLYHMALRDVMRGPEYIVQTLPTKLAEVREARQGFADSTVHRVDEIGAGGSAQAGGAQTGAAQVDSSSNSDITSAITQNAVSTQHVAGTASSTARHGSNSNSAVPAAASRFAANQPPMARSTFRKNAAKAVVQAVLAGAKQDGRRDREPQVEMAAKDAVWPSFSSVSSALVTTNDGDGAVWMRRDSALYRRNLREGLRMARTLTNHWDELAQRYRSSNIWSFETWHGIFGEIR